MLIANATEKMIRFYEGSRHDIAHFLKVWAYARTIGRLEGLDEKTQETLELAAIVHDIACPLCREKYSSAAGPLQEKEGAVLAKEFFRELALPEQQLARICHLVGHHHTPDAVDGPDYRILLEADFLVNADESGYDAARIQKGREELFRTAGGTGLLDSIFR